MLAVFGDQPQAAQWKACIAVMVLVRWRTAIAVCLTDRAVAKYSAH